MKQLRYRANKTTTLKTKNAFAAWRVDVSHTRVSGRNAKIAPKVKG